MQITDYVNSVRRDFLVFEEVKEIIVIYDFAIELKDKIDELTNVSLRSYNVDMCFDRPK